MHNTRSLLVYIRHHVMLSVSLMGRSFDDVTDRLLDFWSKHQFIIDNQKSLVNFYYIAIKRTEAKTPLSGCERSRQVHWILQK